MCGIFGCVASEKSRIKRAELADIAENLYQFSATRGREASGLCLRTNDSMYIHKVAAPPASLCESTEYKAYFERAFFDCGGSGYISFFGHTRLATNGLQAIPGNNQPVHRGRVCAIHNGIIVNVDAVWNGLDKKERRHDIDTELIPAIVSGELEQGKSPIQAVSKCFDVCSGAINTAIHFEDRHILLLATNVGSLYLVWDAAGESLVYASERYILEQLCRENPLNLEVRSIRQVEAGCGLEISLKDLGVTEFAIDQAPHGAGVVTYSPTKTARTIDSAQERQELLDSMRRCTRCVLPESFPFIEFDADGVCNYCRTYKPLQFKGEDRLREVIKRYPNNHPKADCIMAFSGGRDSSYALHYVVEEMGLRPITYSYDWGMVTDLGRRNQARMTGKLGIEHILVSADIAKKRDNIRMNLMAWLKRPNLGMIPLLMAGDKHYYYYANQLKKQTGIGASVWSTNELERAYFKLGLCGVNVIGDKQDRNISFIPLKKRAQVSLFYLEQYLKNPRYFNTSLLDSLNAFWGYFFTEKDYVQFYDYLPWREDVVDGLLLGEYGWEKAVDTETTWRIGDGTAPFYNFVYYMVGGFTENDTLRSNQIREGHISREEGLSLVKRDNAPRYASIEEYMRLINVDINRALQVVTEMETLYGYPAKLRLSQSSL